MLPCATEYQHGEGEGGKEEERREIRAKESWNKKKEEGERVRG